jgi:hypothetical protein
MKNREERRLIVEEDKAHPSCSAEGKELGYTAAFLAVACRYITVRYK